MNKGENAPGFSLKDFNGALFELESFRGKKAVLVVFMCNHCPYVKHKIDAIVALDGEFRERGLQVIGINSNDPVNYPEDNTEGMKRFAKECGIGFPYLVDDTQEVAKAYKATCTPDFFLFDSNLKLAYHGRVDDAMEPGTEPSTQEMKKAIQQLLEGKEVTVKWEFSIGCSIKWK